MVHGLAQQLGGGLRIFSTPGLGTNVEIWLPAAKERAMPSPAASEDVITRAGPRGKALLVDDEEAVRASTAHMLEECGFDVVEAESAQLAPNRLEAGEAFAVLVTDHLMAGMDGTQLARVVRTIRPGLPCLIVSGYGDVEGIAPDLPRLTKPFRASELQEALDVLGL